MFHTCTYLLLSRPEWKQVVCSLVSVYFDSPQVGMQLKKLHKTFMLLIQILIDQISFSNCLYFLRYPTICLLQLFVSQVIINVEINLTFLIKSFYTWPKCQVKNLNILRTKRAFKKFFVTFTRLLVAKILKL